MERILIPILICHGSHGGVNNMCEQCRFDVRNIRPEYRGSKIEPKGKYKWIGEEVCTMRKPYWSQFVAKDIQA